MYEYVSLLKIEIFRKKSYNLFLFMPFCVSKRGRRDVGVLYLHFELLSYLYVCKILSSEKMCDCQYSCREPWLPRQRQPERPEPRSASKQSEKSRHTIHLKSHLSLCIKITILIKFKNEKVIAAEGEQKASRALRDAADVIAESSSALQVRRQSSIAIQYTALVDSVEMNTNFAYRQGRTLFL
jgi:hypothetical protein